MLENIYYISGIVLAIIGVFGLAQILLMKRDAKIKYARQSVDNSIRVIERYLYNFVNLHDALYEKLKKENVPEYDGTIENLPDIDLDNLSKRLNYDFHLLFNELEIISASILGGTCDDDFCFRAIGRTYCSAVAINFDILTGLRTSETRFDYYDNTWELFDLWRNRLIKEQYKMEKTKIERQISEIVDRKIEKRTL